MNSAAPLDIRRNINLVYWFRFWWMFLILIPILVPFLQSHGLSMQDVFLTQVAFGLTVALFEVPSGYFSDLWGRKNVLIAGTVISSLGFTLLNFTRDFWGFVGFEVLLGLGVSLVSGADLSLLYDSIKATESKSRAGTQAMANFQFYTQLSESIGSMCGGFLAWLSLNHVVAVQAVTAWIPLFVAFRFQEPPYQKMDRNQHRENLGRLIRYLFRGEPFVRWVFVNDVIWGLSTFVAVWMFQKNWQDAGITLALFGILWAVYNLVGGLISRQVLWLEGRWGPLPLLFLAPGLAIIGYVLLAVTGSWWTVIAGLLFPASRGISQVFFKQALNWRLPSEFRATANSVSSLFFRFGFCLVGPLVGYGIDRWGLKPTFLSLGAFFLSLALLIVRPLVREFRGFKDLAASG